MSATFLIGWMGMLNWSRFRAPRGVPVICKKSEWNMNRVPKCTCQILCRSVPVRSSRRSGVSPERDSVLRQFLSSWGLFRRSVVESGRSALLENKETRIYNVLQLALLRKKRIIWNTYSRLSNVIWMRKKWVCHLQKAVS